MFSTTITLFNHKGDKWYPTVIRGCYLRDDHSTTYGSHGDVSSDGAQLHVFYKKDGSSKVVSGKKYLDPKEYADCASPKRYFTFSPGGDQADFFIVGEWKGGSEISDDSYINGFYHEMNRVHERVFSISSYVCFNMLPHFEINAR